MSMNTAEKPHRRPSKKVPTFTPPQKASRGTQPSVSFDAQRLLTTVGAGKLTIKIKPHDKIFLQGDPTDAVFYI
jgi:hypothetical protein